MLSARNTAFNPYEVAQSRCVLSLMVMAVVNASTAPFAVSGLGNIGGMSMPFRSEKQRRYLWMKHPSIARRWTKKYGSKIRAEVYRKTRKK